jgi:hypothetical protein
MLYFSYILLNIIRQTNNTMLYAFSFSIIKFTYIVICSNIPLSTAYHFFSIQLQKPDGAGGVNLTLKNKSLSMKLATPHYSWRVCFIGTCRKRETMVEKVRKVNKNTPKSEKVPINPIYEN